MFLVHCCLPSNRVRAELGKDRTFGRSLPRGCWEWLVVLHPQGERNAVGPR